MMNGEQKIAAFRALYREKYQPKRYSGWLHFGFTMSFASLTLVAAASQLSNISWLEWLTMPITFIYANLVEYWAHKNPMHRPFRGLKLIFDRHARQHHRFFTDENMAFDSVKDFCAVLFPPYLIAFFFVGFALPTGLLIQALLSSNTAYLFIITALGYFMLYELMHTGYHLPEDHWLNRQSWWLKMKRLHQHHHHPKLMTHYNFNVTFPIGDWLFGTLYKGTLPSDNPQKAPLKKSEGMLDKSLNQSS